VRGRARRSPRGWPASRCSPPVPVPNRPSVSVLPSGGAVRGHRRCAILVKPAQAYS
jgi:hypothetical protein